MGFTYPVDINGGEFAGGVTLDPNTTPTDINGMGVAGGLGEYAIGSFTADSAMQQFTFYGEEVGVINGFQLRLDGVNSVPETGSTIAFLRIALLMLAALPRQMAARRVVRTSELS